MMYMWWGYVHKNGSIQAKRYLDRASIDDAYDSPFVVQVIEPFEAESRDAALQTIKEKAQQ